MLPERRGEPVGVLIRFDLIKKRNRRSPPSLKNPEAYEGVPHSPCGEGTSGGS